MMKNEELITALRYCAEHDGCDYYIAKDCPIGNTWVCGADCEQMLMHAAADAIEATDRLLDQNTERCEGLRKQLRDAHENYEKHIAELEAQLQTIDAVEVVHGEWVETEKKEWGIYPFKKKTCSVCDCEIDHIFMLACMDYFDDRDTVFHYCPNCGAKMDGEVNSDG